MSMLQVDLHAALKKNFGFENFKGLQEEVIKSIIDGNDTFVIMPTGGGKSLCYQLPALVKEGTAIVISPLIALMKNQVDAIRGISSSRYPRYNHRKARVTVVIKPDTGSMPRQARGWAGACWRPMR